MKIYIDIDDVLCETAATLCVLVEREFGRHVKYEDVHEFDLQKVFSLTDEEMRRFSVRSHDPKWLAAFPETEGAAAGVKRLRALGHEVEIVTGRPASAHRATEEWLAKVGLADFRVTYVDKYGRDGRYAHNPDDPKTVPLEEFLKRNYDVVIDDSPVILRRLASWTDTRVLVFARPWNEDLEQAPNMERINGWAKLLQRL